MSSPIKDALATRGCDELAPRPDRRRGDDLHADGVFLLPDGDVMAAKTFKLKPCPFCGEPPVAIDARDVADDYSHWHSIHCFKCGIEMGDEYLSEVAEAWNRRSRAKVQP